MKIFKKISFCLLLSIFSLGVFANNGNAKECKYDDKQSTPGSLKSMGGEVRQCQSDGTWGKYK